MGFRLKANGKRAVPDFGGRAFGILHPASVKSTAEFIVPVPSPLFSRRWALFQFDGVSLIERVGMRG